MAINCDIFRGLKDDAEKKLAKLREDLYNKQKVELGEKDIEEVRKLMTQAQTMPDGYEKDVIISKAMNVINDKIPATTPEKLKAIQRISLLGNAKTMVRNVVGNVVFGGVETTTSGVVGSQIDKLVSKAFKTELRSVDMFDWGELKKGFKEGYKRAWRDYAERMDVTGGLHKFDAKAGKIFLEHGKIDIDSAENFKGIFKELKQMSQVERFEGGKKVKDLIDWSSPETAWKSFKKLPEDTRLAYMFNRMNESVNFGLKLGDSPFKLAYFNDTMAGLKKLNPNRPIAELEEVANMIMLQRTFQETGAISRAFTQARSAINMGKKFGMGDFILPFTSTPANIMQRIIDYSPLGLVNSFRYAKELRAGATVLNQRKLVDSLTRSFTGTGLLAAGYLMAKQGLINPGISKDPDLNKLRKEIGIQPYSFNVFGKNITYDWSQPLSTLIAIGSDMYNEGKSEEDMGKAIWNAIESGGATLTDQTLLRGMQQLFGGESPVDGLMDSIKNVPTQFIPTLLSQVARTIDPKDRDYWDPALKGQLMNPLKARIPFIRQGLEAQVGTLGEDVDPGGFLTRAFSNFFSPANIRNIQGTEVQQEIMRLYDAKTGRTKHLPRVVSKKITARDPKTREEVKFDLTPQERTKLQRTTGEMTQKVYQRIINSLTYKNMTDEAKHDYLKSTLSKIKKVAEGEIIKERGYIN